VLTLILILKIASVNEYVRISLLMAAVEFHSWWQQWNT